MHFTSGDIVALLVGCIGAFKWGLEIFIRWFGSSSRHDHDDEIKLIQVKSDLEVHKAEDRQEFTWIKASLERIERKVEHLQSQMRFVASGANDKIIEIGRDQ